MLCGIILEAIPPATAVAVAMFDEFDVQHMQQTLGDPSDAIPKPKLMRVQTREEYEARFIPSRRLLRNALVKKECAMHIVGDLGGSVFTMANPLDWEFCVPLTAESCIGWCLYVWEESGMRKATP